MPVCQFKLTNLLFIFVAVKSIIRLVWNRIICKNEHSRARRCRIRTGDTHTDVDALRAEIKIDAWRTE